MVFKTDAFVWEDLKFLFYFFIFGHFGKHSTPVGGGNSPFYCLPTANQPYKEEEEEKVTCIVHVVGRDSWVIKNGAHLFACLMSGKVGLFRSLFLRVNIAVWRDNWCNTL